MENFEIEDVQALNYQQINTNEKRQPMILGPGKTDLSSIGLWNRSDTSGFRIVIEKEMRALLPTTL